MIERYTIDSWPRYDWFQTKGTRNKFTCENPDTGKRYYFKESLNKRETGTALARSYPTEFWSEIIASKVGHLLGFHTLDYNIAYSMGSVGCICEDMLMPRQTLLEGFPFLTAVERDFLPDTNNDSKKLYDFQLIERALTVHKLERFLPNLVEVLVFDAIVGNSDRHQENWGFIFQSDDLHRQLTGPDITKLTAAAVMPIPSPNWRTQLTGGFAKESKGIKQLISRAFRLFNSLQAELVINESNLAVTIVQKPPKEPVAYFTPIFDSGSSLGRELPNEKVEQMLRDSMQFDSYVRRGKSEVHWLNKKIAHETLLANLDISYGTILRSRLLSVREAYKPEQINSLLASTEAFIPQGGEFDHYRLTPARQNFMFKLIDTRLQSLFKAFLPSLV